MSSNRQQYLSTVRSVVVKLGTQLLSDRGGKLDTEFLGTIATQVATLRERKIAVTIVSSGAIGAGLAELGMARRPGDLGKLQAVAAIGQRRLMDAWANAFAKHGLHVAQLLLTREDIDDRTRFLNVRNTVHAVHELGGVPIINENDTISTDELIKISFGDNDILAALVAQSLRADLLVLLSVVDGILNAQGEPVRYVENVDAARVLVRAEKSALGKGGMNSKLEAARMVTESGEALIVGDGRMKDILPRLLGGDDLGTMFAPSAKKRSSRSRWIGSARPVGSVFVDDGAAKAVVEKNRSLLPAGVVKVAGEFRPGDVVAIVNSSGAIIARGLTNYSAADVARVCGKKTAELRELLAEAAYEEVVHRDNLVVG